MDLRTKDKLGNNCATERTKLISLLKLTKKKRSQNRRAVASTERDDFTGFRLVVPGRRPKGQRHGESGRYS